MGIDQELKEIILKLAPHLKNKDKITYEMFMSYYKGTNEYSTFDLENQLMKLFAKYLSKDFKTYFLALKNEIEKQVDDIRKKSKNDSLNKNEWIITRSCAICIEYSKSTTKINRIYRDEEGFYLLDSNNDKLLNFISWYYEELKRIHELMCQQEYILNGNYEAKENSIEMFLISQLLLKLRPLKPRIKTDIKKEL